MTTKAFLYYTLLLISQIQTYRFNLEEKIRNDPILLILDGYPSHINFLSAYLLYVFNIDLLLIPAHTSHILSPFDISLASPIKTFFSQELTKFEYTEEIFKNRQFSAHLRSFVIQSFLNSAHKACIPLNIKSGFHRAGIIPYNPQSPLFSEYSMENEHHLFQNKANNDLPTFYLNSEKGLSYLFFREHNRLFTHEDLNNTFNDIIKLLTENLDIDTGMPLSQLPDILIERENKLERLKVKNPK